MREQTEGPQPGAPIDEIARGDETRAVDVYTPQAVQPVAESAGAVVLATRAAKEVEARALLAKRFPRVLMEFRRKVLESCTRPIFADAGIYSVPRGEKDIEGLSIRFAEECARYYGNLDISSMVVSEDTEQRVIECCVVDLEVNMPWRQSVVITKTVERKHVKKGDVVLGKRLNSRNEEVFIVQATADQTFMEQNRLISKTLRNLILNHIPSDVKEEARAAMEATLRGEITKDPVAARKRIVDAFYKFGVTPAMLADFLGKPIEQANDAELQLLNNVGRGIKQGEGTWEDVMQEKRGPAKAAAETGSETEARASLGKGASAQLSQKLSGEKKRPAEEAPE